MPYKTIAEAKKASFPTHAEDIALTIEQINKLAEIYDAIKKEGTVDIPMAAAWTTWKNIYVKKGDKWVTKEKGASAENFSAGSWIKVARKDQTKKLPDGKEIILTEEGLKKTAASFKNKNIIINHKVAINEPKIRDAKYESPFLYMFFDEEAAKLFRGTDSTGWSVQFDPDTLVFDGNKIVDGVGAGIGLLYGDHTPVCTPEMGCQEQSYTFETYTDVDANNDKLININEYESGTSNAVDPASIEKGLKKEAERIIAYIKAALNINPIKKEVEDQDNKKKNLEKKSKMEKEDELTLELKTVNDELAKAKSEFETVKTAHSDEVKELKEQIATFEQEKEDAKTAKLNADWEQLKKTIIPKGLVHKEEDEKKLKAEFEQSPHEFMMRAFAFERPEPTTEEGMEFETDPDEITKAAKELEKEAGMEVPNGY